MRDLDQPALFVLVYISLVRTAVGSHEGFGPNRYSLSCCCDYVRTAVGSHEGFGQTAPAKTAKSNFLLERPLAPMRDLDYIPYWEGVGRIMVRTAVGSHEGFGRLMRK